MTWKWRKRVSALVIGTVLLTLLPFGGVTASPTDDRSEPSSLLNLGQNQLPNNEIASTASSQSVTEQGASSEEEQRVIVTFKDKKKMDKSLIKGEIKQELKHFPAISAKMSPKEIEKLKKNISVQSVEPDIQLQATAQTMDWGVNVVNATYAWNNGYTGKGVKVAVLDSGVDTHHDDLTVTGGVSFVDYTTSYDDDNGHGTHVAGIIGAKNNDIGVVGVAPDADLYAVKVLGATGIGYLSDVISGIEWAVDNKMDIINMSMATSVDSPALHNAVDQAYASGLLVVAAAGNTGNAEGLGDTIQYPAKYSSVISVGAVDQNNQRASFSATGSKLEVVAPGVAIRSTYVENNYSVLSGTSMAAPFVTGGLALLTEENPTLNKVQLQSKLNQHVNDLGVTGEDDVYGYGVLDILSISEEALNKQIDPNVSDNVVNSVYNNVYAFAMRTGPSVMLKVPSTGYMVDGTNRFADLTYAISIASDGSQTYVLNNNKTVMLKVPSTGYMVDATNRFADLTNAISIASDGNQTYVLYNNKTVMLKVPSTGYMVDATNRFADLTNARAIAVDPESTQTYVGYFDQRPSMNLTTLSDQSIFKNSNPNPIVLTGFINDPDNDNVTISATIAGITKSTTVSNSATSQNWTLQWNVNTDNIPVGTYTNITVSANDGLWGNANATFTGTIVVDNVPNAPSALNPGSTNSSTPTPVSGITPLLNWAFTDPDAGDTQSAYDVQIYKAAGTTLISDSGWVNSGSTNYTVPSGKLARGTAYGWKVAVKDSKGGVSTFSPLYYIKTNNLPALSVTSYTDGQTLADNTLNFTWTYSDADGQAQSSYRIQGSKDNWATIGYDSGVKTGTASSLQTPALPDGKWSFKITVNDGMEWSSPATRNNLIIPNAYEPNDASAQAFGMNYNTTYTSAISSAADADFFKYVAPSTGIDRLTLAVPTGKNYDVFVYDANMNFAASGQLSAAGVTEDLIYRVAIGTTYYIKVIGSNGDYSTSPYTIKVNKYTITNQTNYQFDSNGNITGKTTTGN